LLPDFAGSLVLNVTRQVLCRCLPTYPSFSLRRFPGSPQESQRGPPTTWRKHPNTRRAGQEYQGHLPGLHRAESHLLLCPKCVDTACWNLLAVWFSSGDATNMDEIHRLTRVTARGLHLPRQAFNTDTDRGPKGKGRLMRVCGLRRLESPTIERVRRAPARGSGVATTRTRRTTPSSFLA
jgi:hypothetical protein